MHFEQDLARLSCVKLVKARDLMLERLVHTFPLRESHLKAIITASVEMDPSILKRIDNDGLDVYLEKLMLIPSNSPNLNENRNFEEHANCGDDDFSVTTIQQIGIRQSAVSCSNVAEAGLENIWKTLRQKLHDELGGTSNSEMLKCSTM